MPPYVPGKGFQAFTGGSFDSEPGLLRKLLFGLTQLPHDVYTGQQPLADVTPGQSLGYAAQFAVPGTVAAPRGALGMAGGRLTAEGMGAAQPFYSALGKAVEAAPLKSAPGEQWLGTLRNMPGIKPEEMQWTGFQDWLKGKPSVTKAEATDYLGKNKVNVQEVMKGGPNPNRTIEGRAMGSDPRLETKFSQYQLPGGENYREMLLKLPDPSWMYPGRMDAPSAAAAAKVFRGGHYDEPNVLAHVRFNDRVDAAGKKTLFVEEIQSDWHQKGRKEGYMGGPPVDREALAMEKFGVPFSRLTDASQRSIEALAAKGGSTIPDAPFKKDWPDLALKRMIKHAVDNGYDSVSWTPGKVQADRYDLSKHIKEIEYIKRGDKYELGIDMHRGEPMNKTLAANELDDFVGKEVADKIRSGEGRRYSGHEGLSLTGLDLQVGGEGMKAFYDKMLPAAANKLGKKYGAKVGVTHLGYKEPGQAGTWLSPQSKGEEVWSLPITDAMRKEVGAKGMPLFTGGSPLGAAAMGAQQKLNPDQARKYLTGGLL